MGGPWDDASDDMSGLPPHAAVLAQRPCIVDVGNGEDEYSSERTGLPEPYGRLEAWMARHHNELSTATIAKAMEYGSLDLQMMGDNLSRVMNGLGEGAPPAARLQASIAFYLMGKCARVLSALAEGKPAPTDSWLDAEVYAMMGSYVQEHGQWP